jgi:hypothetical protein
VRELVGAAVAPGARRGDLVGLLQRKLVQAGRQDLVRRRRRMSGREVGMILVHAWFMGRRVRDVG